MQQPQPIINTDDAFAVAEYRGRLLLLHHASKCQHPAHCTQFRCAEAKALWNHITTCTGPLPCSFPDCTDSKFIFKHFKMCKHTGCKICSDVLLTIMEREVLANNLQMQTMLPQPCQKQTVLPQQRIEQKPLSTDLDHLPTLKHASMCIGCKHKACNAMKSALGHLETCKGTCCSMAKRITYLLFAHAQTCTHDHCTVPDCSRMRASHSLLSFTRPEEGL